jgi:excisionase family DNA binding protein
MARHGCASNRLAALVLGEQSASGGTHRDELVSPQELAKVLDLDRRVIYRLVATGSLEAVRFSKRDVRIRTRSVRKFIESGGVKH